MSFGRAVNTNKIIRFTCALFSHAVQLPSTARSIRRYEMENTQQRGIFGKLKVPPGISWNPYASRINGINTANVHYSTPLKLKKFPSVKLSTNVKSMTARRSVTNVGAPKGKSKGTLFSSQFSSGRVRDPFPHVESVVKKLWMTDASASVRKSKEVDKIVPGPSESNESFVLGNEICDENFEGTSQTFLTADNMSQISTDTYVIAREGSKDTIECDTENILNTTNLSLLDLSDIDEDSSKASKDNAKPILACGTSASAEAFLATLRHPNSALTDATSQTSPRLNYPEQSDVQQQTTSTTSTIIASEEEEEEATPNTTNINCYQNKSGKFNRLVAVLEGLLLQKQTEIDELKRHLIIRDSHLCKIQEQLVILNHTVQDKMEEKRISQSDVRQFYEMKDILSHLDVNNQINGTSKHDKPNDKLSHKFGEEPEGDSLVDAINAQECGDFVICSTIKEEDESGLFRNINLSHIKKSEMFEGDSRDTNSRGSEEDTKNKYRFNVLHDVQKRMEAANFKLNYIRTTVIQDILLGFINRKEDSREAKLMEDTSKTFAELHASLYSILSMSSSILDNLLANVTRGNSKTSQPFVDESKATDQFCVTLNAILANSKDIEKRLSDVRSCTFLTRRNQGEDTSDTI